jgi:alcohol dehydrogenase class IV
VLPYVLAFNGPAVPDAERRIAGALGSATATGGLMALNAELGAPRALADYGFAEDSIAEAADAILPAVPPSNPRQVTAADLRALLRAAWSGTDPDQAF